MLLAYGCEKRPLLFDFGTAIFISNFMAAFKQYSPWKCYYADLHEDVITAFRCQQVWDRDVFIASGASVAGLRETAEEDTVLILRWGSSFPHKLELASFVSTWQLGKVQSEKKQNIDASARAPVELVTDRAADWETFMTDV